MPVLEYISYSCFHIGMNKKRNRTKLTKEQREMLEKSPHVVRLTDTYVYFSSAFIDKFCNEYHAGRTAASILEEYGIDPKILGSTRVDSLRTQYRKNWLPRYARDSAKRRTQTPEAVTNSRIEHEIEYLRQEVNALKKIIQIEQTAKNTIPVQPRNKSSS